MPNQNNLKEIVLLVRSRQTPMKGLLSKAAQVVKLVCCPDKWGSTWSPTFTTTAPLAILLLKTLCFNISRLWSIKVLSSVRHAASIATGTKTWWNMWVNTRSEEVPSSARCVSAS